MAQDDYRSRIQEQEGPGTLQLGPQAYIDPRDQRYVHDAYQYFLNQQGGQTAAPSGITAATAAPVAQDPTTMIPQTGGGAGITAASAAQNMGGVNTPEQQRLINAGIGVQAEPGAPISAPGEGMLTQQAIDDLADYPVTPANMVDPSRLLPQIPEVVAPDPTTMMPQLGSETPSYIGGEKTLADAGGIEELGGVMGADYPGEEYTEPQSMLASEMIEAQKASQPVGLSARRTINRTPASQALDDEYYDFDTVDQQTLDAPYGVNPNTGEPYQTPRTIADQNRVLGQTFEADDIDEQGNLSKKGEAKIKSLGFNVLDIAGKFALNSFIGKPISLAFDAIKPDKYDQEAQGALGEIDMLKTTEGGLTTDKYGINVQSAFGDYDDYNLERQIDLQEKVDAGTLKEFNEDGTLTYLGKELEDRKTIEKQLNETRLGEAKQEQQDFVQEIEAQSVVQAGSDAARDQQRDTGVASVSTGIGGRGSGGYQTSSGDVYASAAEAAEKGDGGGGGGKIVCTMMNDSYGFGSFRNKIWLKHSRDMKPEYQIGYHKIFLPLVKLSKKNIVLKKVLEHIAIHRTIDIRQEARGKVHLLGRIYRKILEPICYWAGKNA